MFAALFVVHTLVAFTAARYWMRPLLIRFDSRYNLTPCKEADFYFFCWMWSAVLAMVVLYIFWWEVTRGGRFSLVRRFSKKSREYPRKG